MKNRPARPRPPRRRPTQDHSTQELIRDFGGPEGTLEAAVKNYNAWLRERWTGVDVDRPDPG